MDESGENTGLDHEVPADLLELYEIIEWQWAVVAAANEANEANE